MTGTSIAPPDICADDSSGSLGCGSRRKLHHDRSIEPFHASVCPPRLEFAAARVARTQRFAALAGRKVPLSPGSIWPFLPRDGPMETVKVPVFSKDAKKSSPAS
eukprot:376903_1